MERSRTWQRAAQARRCLSRSRRLGPDVGKRLPSFPWRTRTRGPVYRGLSSEAATLCRGDYRRALVRAPATASIPESFGRELPRGTERSGGKAAIPLDGQRRAREAERGLRV